MVLLPDTPWHSHRQFALVTHFPTNSFVEPVTSSHDSSRGHTLHVGFLAYRMAMLAVALAVWVMSMYRNPRISGVFLTIWSLTLVLLHFLFQAALLIYRHACKPLPSSLHENVRLVADGSIEKEAAEPTPLPLAEKLGWVIATVASHASLVVTIMFWVALYPALSETDKEGNGFVILTSIYLPHIVNFVLMFIDVFAAKIPFRVHHVAFSLVYFVVYSIFYVVYWASGGTVNGGPVYTIADFSKNPGLATLIMLLSILTTPFVGLFWHAMAFLRERFVTAKGPVML